ncbi:MULTISPECIES: zinc-finger domain-containing protein [Sporosarcina]|uniref:Zinc-finger domain-containing protein n=1 Tax=Sporosarcina saromensis TaxID=359365 RepID=A0ABU4G3M8_9BACL|nr:zinc-finger domain-containing protein [Sporosarcina saromensis]MDW0111573.1 zinc-finger domain-containing protein [Sporosarcina saromensis]
MDKLSIMKEIDELLDTYCEGCFVKRQQRKDSGKTKAHQFCIQTCTIGEQLQFLGNEMNKLTK